MARPLRGTWYPKKRIDVDTKDQNRDHFGPYREHFPPHQKVPLLQPVNFFEGIGKQRGGCLPEVSGFGLHGRSNR
jgi:hypothetical protein